MVCFLVSVRVLSNLMVLKFGFVLMADLETFREVWKRELDILLLDDTWDLNLWLRESKPVPGHNKSNINKQAEQSVNKNNVLLYLYFQQTVYKSGYMRVELYLDGKLLLWLELPWRRSYSNSIEVSCKCLKISQAASKLYHVTLNFLRQPISKTYNVCNYHWFIAI